MQNVKRIFVKVAVFLLGLSTAVSAWVGGLAESAAAITLALSPAVCQQTVTGFGTSACWWSHRVTDDNMREDLMQQLYSNDGLGLNIYRYNVGGGVNPDHNRVSNDWHNTESFYVFVLRLYRYRDSVCQQSPLFDDGFGRSERRRGGRRIES